MSVYSSLKEILKKEFTGGLPEYLDYDGFWEVVDKEKGEPNMVAKELPIKSTDKFYCPHCKQEHAKEEIYGEGTFVVWCKSCDKDFYMEKKTVRYYETAKKL